MKLHASIFLSLAALTSFSAQAGDQTTLYVSAMVLPACAFSQKASTLDFQGINPTDTNDAVRRVDFSFKCNDGASNIVFAVNGNATGSYTGNMQNGLNKLPYALEWTPPPTVQWQGLGGAAEAKVTLTGTVTQVNARQVPVGTYTDNVTISVTP